MNSFSSLQLFCYFSLWLFFSDKEKTKRSWHNAKKNTMVVFWILKSWILNSPLLLIYSVTLAKSIFFSISFVTCKTAKLHLLHRIRTNEVLIWRLLYNWWLLLLSNEKLKKFSSLEGGAHKRNLRVQRTELGH